MDSLLHDLRYALRNMSRSPAFTAAAVLSLAFGIGANTAVFSVLDAALLRPLPVEAPEQLAQLATDRGSAEVVNFSYPHYEALRADGPFAGVIGQMVWGLAMRIGDVTEQIRGAGVSGEYFDVLGVDLAIGRIFAADEDVKGAPRNVVVLSHALWQRRFGGSSDVLGNRLQINGELFTIIGVAPAAFRGVVRGKAQDLWIPLTAFAALQKFDFLDSTTTSWLEVLVRMPAGHTLEQAQARVAAFDPVLREQGLLRDDAHHNVLRARGRGFDWAVSPLGRPLTYMLGAVALVLLIACANVANLLLARASARQRELAVRCALGGTRGRITQQLLTEALTLAVLASVVGVVLAIWVAEALARWPTAGGALDIQPGLDLRVLGFTFALTLATGVLFGILPALQATHVNVMGALKERAGSAGRMPVRSALVVLQIALSLTLLVGATLLVRTLRHLSDIDVGYTARTALLADIDLESQRYQPDRGKLLQNQLLERLRALPGVTGASATTFVAPQPAGSSMSGVELEGFAGSVDEVEFDFTKVDPTFFDVVGVPLLSGRGFTAHDVATGTPVAIINQTMARRYWPDTNPIGKRIILDAAANRAWEIVGVVGGGKYRSLRETQTAKVFRPLEQSYASWITLIVRTDGDPLRLGDALRRELRALDPGIPLFDVRTLEQHMAQATSEERMAAQVAGGFSLLALLLASLGIYGVLAYIVTQRRREIGIRMALGARRPEIVRLVVGRGLTLATMGVAAGIPAALLSTRLLQSLVFGVAPGDLTNYSIAVALLLAVAAIATFLPARRATAVDPLVALRHGEE